MYRLTCPSCSHAVTSSFVRVGALVVCESCGHRFHVQESHLQRRPAGGRSGGSHQQAQPAASPSAEALEEAERVRVDAEGNVVGLSGLSEAIGRGDHPGTGRTASVPPAGRRRDEPSAYDVAVERFGSRLLYLGAGILCLLLALLGFGLWYATAPVQSGGQRFVQQAEHDAPALQAEPITPGRWEPVQAGEPLPDSEQSPIKLRSVRFQREPDGRAALLANLHSDHEAFIRRANLTLWLVDGQGQPLARMQLDAAGIRRGDARPLYVPIQDADLAARAEDVAFSASLRETSDAARLLDQALVEWTPDQQPASRLQVDLTNTTPWTFDRLWLLLTGLNDQGQPIALWHATYEQRLRPDQRRLLHVELAGADEPDVRQWRVHAVGE